MTGVYGHCHEDNHVWQRKQAYLFNIPHLALPYMVPYTTHVHCERMECHTCGKDRLSLAMLLGESETGCFVPRKIRNPESRYLHGT